MKNYGRFSGDGRQVVTLPELGLSIRKSIAKRIIDLFEDGEHGVSNSGITSEVRMCYCEDVDIPYELTGESNAKYETVRACFEAGECFSQVRKLRSKHEKS